MPDSVEMPAPVSATMRVAEATIQRETTSIGAGITVEIQNLELRITILDSLVATLPAGIPSKTPWTACKSISAIRFEPSGAIVTARYPDTKERAALYDRILTGARGLPEVTSAAWTASLAGALASGALVARLLFKVRASDPLVIASVVALVGTVGLLASATAARQGLRIDPVAALRDE